MSMILFIALGGAAGSVLRHCSVAGWAQLAGDAFPYGTLFVNVLGSFLIGFLMEMTAQRWQVSPEMRAFMMTGVLGGFTTFSAFSFDALKLLESGRPLQASAYVLASVAMSLLATFGGVALVRQIETG